MFVGDAFGDAIGNDSGDVWGDQTDNIGCHFRLPPRKLWEIACFFICCKKRRKRKNVKAQGTKKQSGDGTGKNDRTRKNG
jgi:hypothetical protein